MNNNSQTGQMTWRPDGNISVGKLYMRLNSWERWRLYTEFPEHVLPDLPGFSEGYATCLALLKKQWQLI